MPHAPSRPTFPSAPSNPLQVADEIVRDVRKAQTFLRVSTHTAFTHALRLWEAGLRPDDEEGWQRASQGLDRALPLLVHALGLLLSVAERHYVDLLGLVYMSLGNNNKGFGHYFTHPNIATFMAEALIGAKEDPPQRVIDAACGSGVMLLAYASAVARRWPGLIERNEIEFYGIDPDEVCSSMARLNLQLHGLGAPGGKPDRVKIMEALQALLPPEQEE